MDTSIAMQYQTVVGKHKRIKTNMASVQVTDITQDAIAVSTNQADLILDFDTFTCFQDKDEQSLRHVTIDINDDLYWPNLKVRLRIKLNPKRYLYKAPTFVAAVLEAPSVLQTVQTNDHRGGWGGLKKVKVDNVTDNNMTIYTNKGMYQVDFDHHPYFKGIGEKPLKLVRFDRTGVIWWPCLDIELTLKALSKRKRHHQPMTVSTLQHVQCPQCNDVIGYRYLSEQGIDVGDGFRCPHCKVTLRCVRGDQRVDHGDLLKKIVSV